MPNLLTIEWAYSYGIELCEAVRPTEEQLEKYSDEYKPLMYYGVSGTNVPLEHLTSADLPKRKSDGCFSGCGNQLYIITREEWDAFVSLNNERAAEKQRKERESRIAYLKDQIAACKRQWKLYTREEAKRLTRNWINVVNEGGGGYVPYYYTQDEYERLKAELS